MDMWNLSAEEALGWGMSIYLLGIALKSGTRYLKFSAIRRT